MYGRCHDSMPKHSHQVDDAMKRFGAKSGVFHLPLNLNSKGFIATLADPPLLMPTPDRSTAATEVPRVA